MAESLDDKVKKLIEANTVTQDINSSLIKINKAYGTSIDRVAKLTGSSEKLGAAWSIVTRATEALAPSVSKALFSLRSLTFLAKYAQLSREEAAKSDRETLELVKTINKERSNSLDLLNQISKTTSDRTALTDKIIGREALYQNEQIGYLIENLGFTEGIAEARKRAQEVSEKTFKIEEKISKLDRDRLYMAHDFSKVRGMDINKVALALKHQEKLEAMEIRAKDIRASISRTRDEESKKVLETQQKALAIAIEEQKITTQAAKDRTGYSFEGGEITRNPQEKTNVFKEFANAIGKVIDTSLFKKLDGVVKFFKGPSIKMIGSYLKMGIVIFAKVLLFITILGFIVYAMHKLGVFDKIAEFFREGRFDGAIDLFRMAAQGFVDIFEGVFGFLQSSFLFFKALFTGTGLAEATNNLLLSFFEMLEKVGMGLFKVLGGLIGGYFALLGTTFLAGAEVLLENLGLDELTENFKRLPKALGGEGRDHPENITKRERRRERKRERHRNFDNFFGNMSPTSGSMGFGGVGMATGGVVASGGMFRVGEEGPEMVALPAGTRVLNNQQTRSMGNTINVHVNGRVGASDQELNELARKLGEKINKEMNRFGASGFRA